MDNTFRIPAVKDGETFTVAGMEFIKFPNVDGKTPVVMKDIMFRSRFGSTNDFRSSDVLKRMQEEILPKIIAGVGEENVCMFKTDLTTLDGLKPYGELESYISLPTLDFYRANVEVFDKHNPGTWWWLATPESAQPHCNPGWVFYVSLSDEVDYEFCHVNSIGVRPFLFFKSSIFESMEAAHEEKQTVSQ